MSGEEKKHKLWFPAESALQNVLCHPISLVNHRADMPVKFQVNVPLNSQIHMGFYGGNYNSIHEVPSRGQAGKPARKSQYSTLTRIHFQTPGQESVIQCVNIRLDISHGWGRPGGNRLCTQAYILRSSVNILWWQVKLAAICIRKRRAVPGPCSFRGRIVCQVWRHTFSDVTRRVAAEYFVEHLHWIFCRWQMCWMWSGITVVWTFH